MHEIQQQILTDPGWVFRPRLPWKVRIAFVICGIFTILGVFIAIVNPIERWMALLCAGFFGGISTLAWLLNPREIIFSDAITIRRHLLADKRIEYRDITGFGLGRLVARNGRLNWSQLDNGWEVGQAIDILVETGVISEDQLDDRAMKNDMAQVEAVYVYGGVLVVLSVLVLFGVIPSSWLEGHPDWVLKGAIPLSVLSITFLIIRFWRYRNPPE